MAGALRVQMQEMAAELKASRTKGDDEKQRLADADAVLRQEVDALRKEQESAQGKVCPAHVTSTLLTPWHPKVAHSIRFAACDAL